MTIVESTPTEADPRPVNPTGFLTEAEAAECWRILGIRELVTS